MNRRQAFGWAMIALTLSGIGVLSIPGVWAALTASFSDDNWYVPNMYADAYYLGATNDITSRLTARTDSSNYTIGLSGLTLNYYTAWNSRTGAVASNSTTFTTVWDAIEAAGVSIRISAGSYTTTANIDIDNNNVKISGEGRATVITRTADAGTTRIFDLTGTTGVEISDMTVNYGDAVTGTNRIFWTEDCSYLYIHDTYTTTYRNNVVFLRNTNYSQFIHMIASGGGDVAGGGMFTFYFDAGDTEYITIERCENYGNRGLVTCDTSVYDHIHHITISNNISKGAKGDQILLTYGDFNKIIGNTVTWEGNTEQMNAIDVRAGVQNVIANNIVHNNGATDTDAGTPMSGIFVGHGGDHGVVISGNAVYDADQGIIMYGESYAQVTGNICVACVDGILIERWATGPTASSYNNVIGNTIIDSSDDGIQVSALNTVGNRLISNNIYNSGGDNISDAGTSTIIKNNGGWVTENSGTATLLNGQVSVTVAHGLSYTPTVDEIHITWAENPTNPIADWWISGIDGTNFVLNGVDPGASNLDFGWSVIKTP